MGIHTSPHIAGFSLPESWREVSYQSTAGAANLGTSTKEKDE